MIVCYGTTHKRPRAVHAECFGEDDDVSAGWLCDACTEDSQEASSQPQQSSQASTQLEYEVRQVLDEQVNPWTGETWFKVRWKSHPNRRYGDSWEPESNCAESADLIRKFRNGEPPSDPGSDRDRDAETPEQALEADEKSSGRYHPALLRGYWSLLRESTDEALAHPTLRGVSSAAYRSIGTEILSAMHWKILCGLTGAGLQRRKAGDPELSMLLDGLMDASVKRPNVYELELVDEDGHPPLVSSPTDLATLADPSSFAGQGDAPVH